MCGVLWIMGLVLRFADTAFLLSLVGVNAVSALHARTKRTVIGYTLFEIATSREYLKALRDELLFSTATDPTIILLHLRVAQTSEGKLLLSSVRKVLRTKGCYTIANSTQDVVLTGKVIPICVVERPRVHHHDGLRQLKLTPGNRGDTCVSTQCNIMTITLQISSKTVGSLR